MAKKSFRPCFFFLPALFVLCLLLNAPVQAQQNENPEKSSGNLYEQFKAVEILPCGKRAEALRLGKLILERYQLAENFAANLKMRLTVLKEEESLCDGAYAGKSPQELLETFKAAAKLPCGQRSEAIRIAKFLFVKHSRRELLDHKKYLEAQIPILEREEKECQEANLLEILFEEFKTARKLPCGNRDEAVRLGREVSEKFGGNELNREVVDLIRNSTAQIEEADKECKSSNSLAALLEEFKRAGKLPCGQREKANFIGKRIIELYGRDESNQDVIRDVEKDLSGIAVEDYLCEQNDRLGEYYKTKNWGAFLSLSKGMLSGNSRSPQALDLMLTFVLVAYKHTAYDGKDTYNGDAVFYAKRAIELIEDGVKTQSRWGIFEPFETKDKALAWMNFTTGYISYFHQKEGKKAIPYFYKATQYSSEFKYDAFVYQAVAIHYFEKEAVTVSSLVINNFITKASSLGLSNETSDSPDETAKNNEIAMLYKQLLNLYNLRYNLEENEKVTSLTDYIQKLLNRPLINTAASGTKGKSSKQASY